MQRVPLNLVKPGMVLAKPIMNEQGMPLCGEGTELSDVLIERLKRMNITTVALKGHPVDLGDDVKTREEQVAEMKARFGHVAGDPLMERIMNSIEAAILAEDGEEEEETEGDDEQG